jgi:hypothetical protein
MGFHPILLVPRYAPAIEVLWRTVLPHEIRLEAEPSAPGHLDAELRYLGEPTDGPTVRMARWTLAHDEVSGRILRLTFPESRQEPGMPYDELVLAFRTVNQAFASAKNGSEPYRFGLAMSSKLLLTWLLDDEALLRPALTPPFSHTLA